MCNFDPMQFIMWVSELYEHAASSVIVNGFLTEQFKRNQTGWSPLDTSFHSRCRNASNKHE